MPFGTLWLPVIVSAVVVFFISFVLHMVLKYHKADYQQLPGEDAIREAIGKVKPAPGLYVTPYCDDHKKMAEPAFQEKSIKGPVAMVVVGPNGPPKMGKQLVQWFFVALFISFLSSYVVRHSGFETPSPRNAMRIVTAVAFGCYGVSHLIDSVWMMRPWGNTVRAIFDAAIYSAATGATFYFLWPAK
ncbi:MAG: hypothetical protein U0V87_12400 [Acidobacteriota bacterium]